MRQGVKAALIGLGNIAWKYDARSPGASSPLSQAGALLKHPGVELIGGCSPDAEDREGFAGWSGGAPAFSDAEEMLASLRPDLVGVCSPTRDHCSHAKMCFDAGVRMLWLEKPAAATAEELDELIRLARGNGCAVCVNYFRRYLPSYRTMRETIGGAGLGACRTLRVLYSPGLLRNGVHMMDQLFFLTGAVSYELLWVERGEAFCPSFAVLLDTGQVAEVTGADVPYHTNDIEAVCDGGILSLTRGGAEGAVRIRREDPLFPGFWNLAAGDIPEIAEPSMEGYMSSALADLLDSGGGRKPSSNLETARLTQCLVDEVMERAAP